MKKIVIIGFVALASLGGLTYCNWSDKTPDNNTENVDKDKEKENGQAQENPIDTTKKDSDSSEVKPADKKEEKAKPEVKPEEKEVKKEEKK